MLTGRKTERETLKRLLDSPSSELITVYGRRRVGKTFLIRESYKRNIVFELTGLHNGNLKDQLQNFHHQLCKSSKRFEKNNIPPDWLSAFIMLEKYINAIKSKKKKVVFIDEFPWIATARSKFLMAFENFWNSYCSKRNDLVVVVCGSAASFMVNKIINNKGGLHNRISENIRLLPFNLNEVKEFLKRKHITINNYDILKLYMAIGGVPLYLEKIRKEESVVQNIDRLCFTPNGFLVNEFNEVFKSLFKNSEVHEKIVRTLSKMRIGTTRNKLLQLCKMQSSGIFSKALNELIESGFVLKYLPFGKSKRDSLFRLNDEYSLFYLRFIETHLGQGVGTWTKLFSKQTYKIWTGLVFETICLKHINQIKAELGIEKIYSVSSGWHNPNAQIDLIIDRDDGIINLFEMKFYDKPYTINKKEFNNLRNKIFEFKESTQTRKSVIMSMITSFGLKENANSRELITHNFTLEILFN